MNQYINTFYKLKWFLCLRADTIHSIEYIVHSMNITVSNNVAQYDPLTLKIKSYGNLYPTSYLLAAVEWSIKIFRHKASCPHNYLIRFRILAKSLRNVEGVALKRSVLSWGMTMTCGLCSAPYCDATPPTCT